MSRRLILSLLLALPLCAVAAPDFEKEIRPLLETHCFSCHGEKKQKGGVELHHFSSTSSVLKQHKLWRNVLDQIEHQDMPPEEKDPLPEAERLQLVDSIKQTLALLESDDPSLRDPGPGVVRRLSRTEYDYSIRDLLGIEVEVKEAVGMPEDNTGRGYANFAAALTIPPAIMEKYFAAADAILARLYRDPGMKSPNKGTDEQAYKKLFANVSEDRAGAQQLLAGLLRRAYRRPLEAGEVERLLKFYDVATAKGEPFPVAVRRALKPIFVSPHFLFRVEENRAPEGSREAYAVSDVELASRLSYFLWSAPPDEALLALAERNELSKPETLATEVKRMLADKKARALTDHFTTKWLQLDLINEARPSTEFFPSFNWDMRQAMKREVATFADYLRENDRSILEFLQADFTFVNEILARHYGIDGVKGHDFQKVAVKAEEQRGGVLGMAGILALTLHTNRTSPTQRGKWVLEVIFGTPPSSPPANVSQINENKKDASGKVPSTFREKLALHASDASCMGCHKKIDPLGFGLENYDAIGSWRAGGPDLDTSGELPGGRKFNGAGELKKIIWERRSEFVRNLTSEMLAYGLGRELDYYDVRTVSKIASSLEAEDHRFSALVLAVVRSYPFLHRRNAEPAEISPAPAVAAAAN